MFQGEAQRIFAEARAAAHPDTPLVDALMGLFGRFLAFFARDPELSAAILREFFLRPYEPERLGALTREYGALVAELVEAARARREIRADVPAAVAANALFAHYAYWVQAWLGSRLVSRKQARGDRAVRAHARAAPIADRSARPHCRLGPSVALPADINSTLGSLGSPAVHFASFDLGDPLFDACGLRLSVQIVTVENLYGADPERVRVESCANGARVTASGLRAAGGQLRAAGSLELVVEERRPGVVRLRARATAPARVRCVKLLLRDLDPALSVSTDGSAFHPVGAHGEVLGYPMRIPTPLVWLRAGDATLALRFEDDRVREKRFALSRERIGELAGRGCAELIHEESASRFAPSIETPEFVVDLRGDAANTEREHVAWLERAFGLVPFESRADVPAWARELRLVAVLHGMHWSGRVLLDYAAMEGVLRFVASRVDGRRVLAYLPGWEGRYYWQYGEYRAEPRLGGDAGFARLGDTARALGVHLMPMFGANCVNAWLPRFASLDPRAYLKSATGNRFHGNTPDWDLSRAHDTGWQAWLNPGHPGWRDDLAGQIEALAERFGFDGVFLDTTEVWTNDPDHDVFDGYRALAARLHAAIPNLLLAGEYDYDALDAVFPLFQRAWWTRAPGWSRRYVRRMAHLCEGEPEGRTGVHEFGVWKDGCVAAEEGLLATIAFQDGTLARSGAAIEAALARIGSR